MEDLNDVWPMIIEYAGQRAAVNLVRTCKYMRAMVEYAFKNAAICDRGNIYHCAKQCHFHCINARVNDISLNEYKRMFYGACSGMHEVFVALLIKPNKWSQTHWSDIDVMAEYQELQKCSKSDFDDGANEDLFWWRSSNTCENDVDSTDKIKMWIRIVIADDKTKVSIEHIWSCPPSVAYDEAKKEFDKYCKRYASARELVFIGICINSVYNIEKPIHYQIRYRAKKE